MDIREWDRQLPVMELGKVQLAGDSLTQAWQAMGEKWLLRTVLVVTPDLGVARPFTFESDACRGADLLNAVVAAYPEFVWTQDGDTGVIWVHPQTVELANILGERVSVPRRQLGVPMLTGVLEPIRKISRNAPAIHRGSEALDNTFNYAVAVPEGTFSIRDMLNQCCLANPSKTFFVSLDGSSTVIYPVNLVSDQTDTAPVGAVSMWNLATERSSADAPSAEEIRAGLASADGNVRAAARAYLETMIFRWQPDAWIRETEDVSMGLWIAVAAAEIHVRIPEVGGTPHTNTAVVQRIKTAADAGVLEECDPKLAVIAALEYARLTDDMTYVQPALGREIDASDLRDMAPEVFRICRSAPRLRAYLTAHDLDLRFPSDLRVGDARSATERLTILAVP